MTGAKRASALQTLSNHFAALAILVIAVSELLEAISTLLKRLTNYRTSAECQQEWAYENSAALKSPYRYGRERRRVGVSDRRQTRAIGFGTHNRLRNRERRFESDRRKSCLNPCPA